MSADAQAANIVCKNHFFEQVELAQLLYKQQCHSYGVVHSSILQRLLPYHLRISLSLMGKNGQSRVCMNIRSCESIEIKKDGRKVVQPFAPVTELNIMETVHRKGFTTQQVAERLGVTKAAVSQMTSGNPTLSTIYKIAWAIGVDPRDFFYRMASDGTIIEEPKVSFEKLKEYAERERLGPLFAQTPQDAHKVLVCPNCATAFLVTNIPRYAEEKNDTKV